MASCAPSDGSGTAISGALRRPPDGTDGGSLKGCRRACCARRDGSGRACCTKSGISGRAVVGARWWRQLEGSRYGALCVVSTRISAAPPPSACSVACCRTSPAAVVKALRAGIVHVRLRYTHCLHARAQRLCRRRHTALSPQQPPSGSGGGAVNSSAHAASPARWKQRCRSRHVRC